NGGLQNGFLTRKFHGVHPFSFPRQKREERFKKFVVGSRGFGSCGNLHNPYAPNGFGVLKTSTPFPQPEKKLKGAGGPPQPSTPQSAGLWKTWLKLWKLKSRTCKHVLE